MTELAANPLEYATRDELVRALTVARESERAAIHRAAELVRVNAILAESVSRLSHDDDPGRVLDRLVEQVASVVGAYHVFLFAYDANTDTLALQRSWLDGVLHLGPRSDELPLWAAPFPSSITPAWRLMCERRGLHTPANVRISTEEFAWPGALEYMMRIGASDAGHMALFVGDEPVGSMGFSLTGGRTLPVEDIVLVEAISRQAAVALKLVTQAEHSSAAAVAKERAAAAEKRAAGLAAVNNVLKRSLTRLTSHNELSLFLGAVLVEAVTTAGAVSGAVFLYSPDTDTLRAEAHLLRGELIDIAVDPRAAAFREPMPANTGRAWEFLAHERRPYWVDYSGPPDPDDWPQSHAWHNLHGHRFVGCIPMVLGDDVIGFLGLAFDKSVIVQPSPERLEICHSIAQHATLAVRLTRLAEEAKMAAVARERQAAAEQRAADLTSTNAALKQTLDAILLDSKLDTVLGQILMAITRHLRSPASAVWLADGDSGRQAVRLVYHEGRVVEVTQKTEKLLNGAWGRGRDLYFKDHLRLRKPVVYQVDGLREADPRACEFFLRLGFHTLLGIPLLLGEEIVGSLTVRFDTRRDLRAEDLELAQAMAHQATMAIQLTRLAERAGEAAVLGERTRLAREIHDTVAQGLVAILMHTRAASSGNDPAHHLAVTQKLAEENLAETRRAVQALRPSVAGSDGLVGSLRRLAERLTESGGMPIRVRTPDHLPEVPVNIEDELGRIAREAAANAVRHSGAEDVTVEVLADGPGLRLTITDSGRGFDTDLLPEGRYGIVGMIERAERIGAALTIISDLGRGTAVVVAWQPGRGIGGGS